MLLFVRKDDWNGGIYGFPSLEAPGVVISILIPIPEIGKPISFNCLRGKLTLQPNVLVKIIINDRLDKCRRKTEKESPTESGSNIFDRNRIDRNF